MFGLGILKGMKVTMKRFWKKKVTMQYPEVKPNLPARSRGSFSYDIEKCISCNLCADACPNGVIRVDSARDEKGKKNIQQYNMNLGYCLFCNLCVKACPTKCLSFTTDFDMVCFDAADTLRVWKKEKIKTEELPEKTVAVAENHLKKAAGV